MRLIKTVLPIGLDRPFRFLHASDHHIARADARDGERKMLLSAARSKAFCVEGKTAEEHWQEHKAYVRSSGLPLLHTGDFCDFVSCCNLEYAREEFSGLDLFFAAGNHEFSLYVGETFEDEAYKLQNFARVQRYFHNHLLFDSCIMENVNFVAVDNGYYRFNAGQLFCLKEEVKKGLPIILCMHNPLHTDDLYQKMRGERKNACAYLTGTPEEMLQDYDDYRYRQQKPDEETLRFIDYVYEEKLIKAVLCGHLHENYETVLPSGIMQIVTGGGYKGYIREIELR